MVRVRVGPDFISAAAAGGLTCASVPHVRPHSPAVRGADDDDDDAGGDAEAAGSVAGGPFPSVDDSRGRAPFRPRITLPAIQHLSVSSGNDN